MIFYNSTDIGVDRYLRPRMLRSGDRVAVVSPSSRPDRGEVALGMEQLKKAGLVPVEGKNLHRKGPDGMSSAPVEDRVAEMVWAIEDESVDGILVSTGGFGCAQILPFLPYGSLSRTAKPLMGFSDTTALSNGILAKVGLMTILGPSATIRKKKKSQKYNDIEALGDALSLLSSRDPWGDRPFADNPFTPKCINPGRAVGHAIGGNLTTFAALLGTPYFPDCRGAVVFLEDIDAGGYDVSVCLLHLSLAGVFSSAAAVIFGEFIDGDVENEPGDETVDQAIRRFMKDGPPCVTGMNFSHGETCAPIPIGGKTLVVSDPRGSSIKFSFSMSD